jgi:endonuclease YncB( thermonuclease family)
MGTLRSLLLLGALGAAWVVTQPDLVEPFGPLATTPLRVSERFTRCERGRAHGCVVDGDTFKLGQRSIRIVGIDAPETHPARCAAEAAQGEAATARLLALLNAGPFEMIGSAIDATDRYGRDLRVLKRGGRSIGDQLVEEGLVRRYGGFKMGWC